MNRAQNVCESLFWRLTSSEALAEAGPSVWVCGVGAGLELLSYNTLQSSGLLSARRCQSEGNEALQFCPLRLAF